MSKQINEQTQLLVASVSCESENKEESTKIELRSGEVQELMRRPPAAILRSGITVIFFFVVLFFTASFFIVYPDNVIKTAKLYPSMDIDYVNSSIDGRLLWVIDSMNTAVTQGDTLAKMLCFPTDTVYVISPIDGHAFKVDVLEPNMDIKAGQHLFCISKTDNVGQTHKVCGAIYLPADSASMLRLGQLLEISFHGRTFPFVISEFGKIFNEEGEYPIMISFIDSLNCINNVEPVTCSAKIQMSNQTIFEKFFAMRMNIFDKYKINK